MLTENGLTDKSFSKIFKDYVFAEIRKDDVISLLCKNLAEIIILINSYDSYDCNIDESKEEAVKFINLFKDEFGKQLEDARIANDITCEVREFIDKLDSFGCDLDTAINIAKSILGDI